MKADFSIFFQVRLRRRLKVWTLSGTLRRKGPRKTPIWSETLNERRTNWEGSWSRNWTARSSPLSIGRHLCPLPGDRWCRRLCEYNGRWDGNLRSQGGWTYQRYGQHSPEGSQGIERCCQDLKGLSKIASEHAVKAKSYENQMEKAYHVALANLFKGTDTVYMLKMREIYRHLSNAADRGDEAANLISSIVMKHSWVPVRSNEFGVRSQRKTVRSYTDFTYSQSSAYLWNRYLESVKSRIMGR